MENTTIDAHNTPVWTMEEVARHLRVSRAYAYTLIAPPYNLPAVRVGKVWRVEKAKFLDWLDKLPVELRGEGQDGD